MSLKTTILMVRHGDVPGIKPARFRGRRDLDLSPEGEAQAQAAAGRVARDFHIDALYASPLKRCQQTAARLAEATGLGVETLEGLIDVDYGDWTWRTHDEVAAEQPDAFNLWHGTPDLMRFPGGDSLADFAAAAMAAMGEAAARHPGGCVALVTHDAVVRALVIEAMGLPLRLYHRLKVAPGSLSALAVGGEAELVKLNDTGHL
jgi:broad specificity phosphatase PhoE